MSPISEKKGSGWSRNLEKRGNYIGGEGKEFSRKNDMSTRWIIQQEEDSHSIERVRKLDSRGNKREISVVKEPELQIRKGGV